jgi:hypothetical protein
MRPAGSAAASRPSPRARPASAWCPCATRSGWPSPVSSPPAPGPTSWCSQDRGQQRHPPRGPNSAVHPQPAPRLPGRGRRRRRGPGHLDLHGPHDLRDLAGRRRYPLSGDRRADGPCRWEAPRRHQWKSDGQGLPRDDADDAPSCHRGPGRTDRPGKGNCRKPAARRRGMDRD